MILVLLEVKRIVRLACKDDDGGNDDLEVVMMVVMMAVMMAVMMVVMMVVMMW